MPLSIKFLPESTDEKCENLLIGPLAKIWTEYNSLLFWPTLYKHSCKHKPMKKLTNVMGYR